LVLTSRLALTPVVRASVRSQEGPSSMSLAPRRKRCSRTVCWSAFHHPKKVNLVRTFNYSVMISTSNHAGSTKTPRHLLHLLSTVTSNLDLSIHSFIQRHSHQMRSLSTVCPQNPHKPNWGIVLSPLARPIAKLCLVLIGFGREDAL
jgi:hypothetical protein